MWKRVIGATTAVVIYAVVSSIVLAMAQGYTWDRNQQKVVITSVFEVNSFPTGAEISVDNEQLKQLTPVSLAQMPGTYLVDVKKEGYYPWQFSTVLFPQLLTQVPEVPLFPQPELFQSLSSSDQTSKLESFNNGKLLVTQTEKALHWWQEKNGVLKEIFTVPTGTTAQYACQIDGPACLVVNDGRAYLLDLEALRMEFIEGRPLLYDQHRFFRVHEKFYLLAKQADTVILQKIDTAISSQQLVAGVDAFTLFDNQLVFVKGGAIWEQSLITNIPEKIATLVDKEEKIAEIYADQAKLVWRTNAGSVVLWNRLASQSVGRWQSASLKVHNQLLTIVSGAKAWVVLKDQFAAVFLGQMADTVEDISPYGQSSLLVALADSRYVLAMKEPQMQNTIPMPFTDIEILANQTIVALKQGRLFYYSFPVKSWFPQSIAN